MKTVKRFDRGKLSGAEKTAQGFLRAPAYLTRVGVLKYKKPDGSIQRELRLPEDVFNKDSLATLASIPVTNDHPAEMLDATNAKKYMVGYTSETVERDGDKIKSILTLTDADAIKAAEGGRQEVSCGYFADLEEKPGKFDGEEYDVIQRNIRYNHAAIVDKGRAGPEVRMRLDSADAVVCDDEVKIIQNGKAVSLSRKDGELYERCVEKVTQSGTAENPHAVCTTSVGRENNQNQLIGEKKMKMILGGKEYDMPDDLHAAVMAELEKVKATQVADAKNAAPMEEMKKEIEKKDAAISTLQAKVDGLTDDLKKRTDSAVDATKISEAVKSRRRIEKVAESILSNEAQGKMDSMSDVEIKTAVIKAKSPDATLDGKSAAYLDARFDHIAETVEASDKKANEIGNRASTTRTDVADIDAARAKMRKDSQDAWKQPLSAVKA